MNSTGGTDEFNIGYTSAEVYEQMLPPHYYGGHEDIDLIRTLLHEQLGAAPAHPTARVLDLGCGPGRLTSVLAPYTAQLHGTDTSTGMISAFQSRFPTGNTRCQDTETVLHAFHDQGYARGFDLIGSFWSMSYPLLECFEHTTADGIVTTSDPEAGQRRAQFLIQQLVELLAPHGHLLMLFFDANTEEQRLVTHLWERIAPFPGTGRDYTWRLLHQGLLDAEAAGSGTLRHTRLPGVAIAPNPQAAREWFLTGHLNSYPALRHDPAVQHEITAFTRKHTQQDGRVLIPSAVHLVHFHATTDRRAHLPTNLLH